MTKPPLVWPRSSSWGTRRRVANAYRIEEGLRDFYARADPAEVCRRLAELHALCLKRAMPREIQRVGRTIRTCFGKLGLPVGDYPRSRPPQPPLPDAQRDAVHDADVLETGWTEPHVARRAGPRRTKTLTLPR